MVKTMKYSHCGWFCMKTLFPEEEVTPQKDGMARLLLDLVSIA